MDLIVTPDGAAWQAVFGEVRWPCAIGKGGVSNGKQEGDGATPIGCWPLRQVFYRPDRLTSAPPAPVPCRALAPDDGWCDDPADPLYNQAVRLPYAGRHEELWRSDRVYDVIVTLGYNDDPPVAGRGSAIFLHNARPDFSPTEGCVALAPEALLAFLGAAKVDTRVCVQAD